MKYPPWDADLRKEKAELNYELVTLLSEYDYALGTLALKETLGRRINDESRYQYAVSHRKNHPKDEDPLTCIECEYRTTAGDQRGLMEDAEKYGEDPIDLFECGRCGGELELRTQDFTPEGFE